MTPHLGPGLTWLAPSPVPNVSDPGVAEDITTVTLRDQIRLTTLSACAG